MAEGSRSGAGLALVLTLTAPGSKMHRDWTRPGGPWCDCTPAGGVDLADWNGRQGERWNRFMQDLRRSGLLGDVEYGRAVEVQDGKRRADGKGRMALHEHALLRCSRVVQVTEQTVAQLRALAIRHGYGHEVVVERAAISEDGRARLAAWYAAKYVAKAADVRDEIPWKRRDLTDEQGQPRCDKRTGEVLRSPWSYRTWTASRGWGCSMRQVREAQRLWAQLQARRGEGVDLLSPALATAAQPPPPGPGECPSPVP